MEYPKDRMKELSVRYSCPEWILDLWKKTYEPDVIEAMLADFQTEKPLTVRCCLNRTTPELLKEELEAEGLQVTAHPYLPYALCISGYDRLDELDAFRNGLFTVQDISSMLVSEIADPHAPPAARRSTWRRRSCWRMKLRVRRRAAMWKPGT